MTDNQLLKELEDATGMSVEEMLEQSIFDGTSEGICIDEDCLSTAEVEPDNDSGWCPVCGKNTVKSACILAGII